MTDRPEHSVIHEKQLRGATTWQWNPYATPELLSESVERFLTSRDKQFERSEKIVAAWKNTVPAMLQGACRMEGFGNGALIVSVLTGPYLHQMQTIKEELLRELKRQCPQCGLQQIKILPGTIEQEPTIQ